MKPQTEGKIILTILNQSTVVLVITRWWVFPEVTVEPLPSCTPLTM